MKKIAIFIIFGIISLAFISPALATSGACSWHGGVSCSAGADWDGSVICNDGWRDSSVSYSSMIMCQDYYYPTTPSCLLNSTYDYLSETCKCNYGYVVGEDFLGKESCVYGDSYCRDKYGYNSQYDSLDKTCECRYGYLFKDNKCISQDDYCEDLYGWNAEYNSLYDKCECGYGYVFGKGILGDIQCIDGDSYCHDLFGYNSSFDNLSEECECDYGYYFNGDECVYENSSAGGTDYSDLLDLLDDYNTQQTSCYLNSYLGSDDKCYCNTGYVKRDNVCISHTEDCKKAYGENIYGTTNNNGASSCYCSTGYEWNSTMTQCVKKETASQVIVQPPYEGKVLGESISAFIEEEKELLSEIDEDLTSRLKGKILLQVEEHGEAWYVYPEDGKKYYMADGNEAYNIMRYLGVGITDNDLERVKADKSFAKTHSGKIFLQVEANGEAYYIDFDGDYHYLKDGEAAYGIMRDLGLGITNIDLRKIGIEEI